MGYKEYLSRTNLDLDDGLAPFAMTMKCSNNRPNPFFGSRSEWLFRRNLFRTVDRTEHRLRYCNRRLFVWNKAFFGRDALLLLCNASCIPYGILISLGRADKRPRSGKNNHSK